MKYIKYIGALAGISLWILGACTPARNRRLDTASAVTRTTEEQESLRTQAWEFDQWVKRSLSPVSERQLIQKCRENLQSNAFCWTMLNRKDLEARARKRATPLEVSRKRTAIQITKGKVVNWIDLRFSSVQSILKSLNHVKPNDIELLVSQALNERSCPNNIAIALAADLEDKFPEKVSGETLAKLYQVGGECLSHLPSEMEVMLTRAGLHFYTARRYHEALGAFEKVIQNPEAFRARPLYWAYRTYLALNQTELAEKTLEELERAYPFSFHTLVLLTSQGKDPGVILDQKERGLLTRSQQLPNLNNLIGQVELLNQLGFPAASEKVLTWAIAESQGAEPEVMIYLSDLSEGQGNYLKRLSLLSDVLYQNPEFVSLGTMEKYFPKVYFPIFEKHSNGIDPYLLLALARRESAFNPKALSRARAKGLMQITPATLREVSVDQNLFDPEQNVFVGARYLSDLLGRVSGQIHLALAAYNAGPHRMEAWLKRYPVEDPILFIDMIPYRETREYVASVLRNYYWYRRIHTDSPHLTPKQFFTLTASTAQTVPASNGLSR